MKNCKLLLIVSLVLALTMSLGGTLAYLTDSDADINVMTVGRVDIVQNEQERNEDGELVAFTQNKPVLPAVYEGSSIPWDAEENWPVTKDQAWKTVQDIPNVVDKFVTVTNKGNTPAYVRTIIAWEVGAEGKCGDYMHLVSNGTNITDGATWTWKWLKNSNNEDVMLTIGGNTYMFYEAVYTEALASKATTIPNLKQIYLDKTATNEIVANYGETFDIIALSQAVQANGFAAADGKTAAEVALNEAFPYVTTGEKAKTIEETLTEWFTNVNQETTGEDNVPPEFPITNEEELGAALAAGGEVTIGANITSENGFAITKDTALNLNGYTLTVTGERANLITVEEDEVDLTITNGKMVVESTNGVVDGTNASTGASRAVYFESNAGKLTMEDVQIEGSKRGGHRAIEVFGGEASLTNVDINGYYGNGVNAGAGASVVLVGCDITVTGMYNLPYNSTCFSVMSGGEMTINSGNYKLINNNTFNTGDTHGGWVGIVMNSGGTLTINGGTYTNVPTEGFKAQYERAIIAAENGASTVATVTLNGGMFNPQNNKVTEGYGVTNYPTVNGTLTTNGTLVFVSGCTWTTK